MSMKLRDNSVSAINKAFAYFSKRVDYVQANSGSSSSSSIPATAYASNSEAVAALGVGVLYKSTTIIGDSPVILITV